MAIDNEVRMQSSSQLFPVQLVSAEVIGSFVEDIYLLKPNNSLDRSVELAVTRLTKNKKSGPCSSEHGEPIILLHGAFSNRRHWLSAEGEGVAAFLVEAGFDVWLPEMRGHGLSPINDDFANNSLDKVIEYDLPAIHKFVVEQTGKKITYIAEEMGGFSILASLALGSISQQSVARCVYIEEEKPLSLRLNTKIFAKNALWRSRKSGIVNGRRLNVGAENETYSIVKQYLCWQNRLTFNAPSGLQLEGAYSDISVPFMVVGATSADTIAPAKNAKWIFNQLTSATKKFDVYDYSESHTSRRYPDGGITLFPLKEGYWHDIVLWLDSSYSKIEPDAACRHLQSQKKDEQVLVAQ